jgi:hypothetical protein
MGKVNPVMDAPVLADRIEVIHQEWLHHVGEKQ